MTFLFSPKQQTSAPPAEEKKSWLGRLGLGLKKSSAQLGSGVSAIFTRKKLDEETLQSLEELLIRADMGVAQAACFSENLRNSSFGKDVDEKEIREALAADIAATLKVCETHLDFSAAKPFVLLMAGVNGTGKTTTLGKMALRLQQAGNKVLLVAADTFRAAATAQLEIWATRSGSKIIKGEEGADPASLAYSGLSAAKDGNMDIVMIDTAGRLHNKNDLMAELQKIVRVIRKVDETAPHGTLLVLDATTGQNALTQVEVFSSMLPLTGLIVTKLDGSAKGGILVNLAEKFKLPVVAIGVGEGIDDLQPFEAAPFARALCGLEA
jgi:fused signal recognition particle receptor